jgi:hypothetical protein
MDPGTLAEQLRQILNEGAVRFPPFDSEGASAWAGAVKWLFLEVGRRLAYLPRADFDWKGRRLDAVWLEAPEAAIPALVLENHSPGVLQRSRIPLARAVDLGRPGVTKVLVYSPRLDLPRRHRIEEELPRIRERIAPKTADRRRSWWVLTITAPPGWSDSDEELRWVVNAEREAPRVLVLDLWVGFRDRHPIGTYWAPDLVLPLAKVAVVG